MTLTTGNRKQDAKPGGYFPGREGNDPRLWGWVLTCIVAVFPVAVMFSTNAADACLFVLLLSGIWVIVSRKSGLGYSFKTFLVRYWPLCLAMSSMLIAVFLNQLFVAGFRAKFYDLPLRFVMVPIIVYGLLILPSGKMRHVQWGLIAAPVFCAVLLYIVTRGGVYRGLTEEYVGILLICFTNLTLLLGFLAFSTIKWDESRNNVARFLKLLAFFAALYSIFLSQTRASWIAAAVLALLSVGLFVRVSKKVFLISVVFCIAVFIALASFSKSFQARINEARSDIVKYMDGSNRYTSIGIRFQLYQAAWTIFQEHPLFGAGNANYDRELEKIAERGIIDPRVARSGHSHNELLHRMAWHGLFGGIAVMLCTFLPLFYFFPYRHSEDRVLKTVAYMGMIFLYGFLFVRIE
ncbi:O-antigen ligase family protein [Oxalobacter sp. OttesenSCG-928-P03]|nr:O-antigen ligase family protein [Oxalobacter sp. OttesenSCG-928-P03]